MMIDKDLLLANINECRQRVQSALDKAGRLDDVMIVGASKTMLSEVVDIIDTDNLLSVLGENRVSELIDKYRPDHKLQWHFIGTLQSNKVKQIIDKVSLIHSVDRYSIANEISKQAKKKNITVNILIQVNMGRELSKSGFDIEELDSAIFEISKLDNIRVLGIMAVMPLTDENELISLYSLLGDRYKILSEKYSLTYLSAGMTNDYELAIIYAGSNIVRLGRAIFGERSFYGQNE